MDSLTTVLYSDIKGALAGMAQGLGVAAEHVYSILLTQQTVNSVTWLIVLIVCLLLIMFSTKYLLKAISDNTDYTGEQPEIIAVISGVTLGLSCIALLICLMNMSTIVTGLFNPEYGAIKEIMQLVK